MRTAGGRKATVALLLIVALPLFIRFLFDGRSGRAELVFLGGAGEVGGSCLLVDAGETRFLVDYGSTFGTDALAPPPDVSFVIITHAHLDHCGRLPELFAAGFRGSVYCSPPTADLLPIMLRMVRSISREDAGKDDFTAALAAVVPVPFDSTMRLGRISFALRRAEHLLGAAFVEIDIGDPPAGTRIVVSGDLGSGNSILLQGLERCERADYVVMESTYGGVRREASGPTTEDTHEPFGRAVGRALERGGDVLVPAFTLGRTQEVMAAIELFRRNGVIPPGTLVYVDSPTAQRITEVYRAHGGELSRFARNLFDGNVLEYPALREVRSKTSLAAHGRNHSPSIFISSSGNVDYANSPRHLMRMYSDRRNLCCIVGYQAPGSTGARLLGEESPLLVRCREGNETREEWILPLLEVEGFESFSGHADHRGLLDWLGGIEGVRRVFLVHGEAERSEALAAAIEEELEIGATVPRVGESHTLRIRTGW
jgi:metallo-beta-lactamase family protein